MGIFDRFRKNRELRERVKFQEDKLEREKRRITVVVAYDSAYQEIKKAFYDVKKMLEASDLEGLESTLEETRVLTLTRFAEMKQSVEEETSKLEKDVIELNHDKSWKIEDVREEVTSIHQTLSKLYEFSKLLDQTIEQIKVEKLEKPQKSSGDGQPGGPQ